METEGKKNQKPDEAETARKTKAAPAIKAAPSEGFTSELTAPRWSVVSFENCLAGNLTYDEAAKKSDQLNAKKIAGLCIVTNEAAERITN